MTGSESVVTDSDFEFDVALSFAGEDRDYVESVAQRLTGAGVNVFYDRAEEVELWGRNLYTHLDEVYRIKARYCVMFISAAYRDKVWTSHERESAQARALAENEEYILPVRFDDTEIPGLRSTIGYIDLRGRSPEALADLILEKVSRAKDAQMLDRTLEGEVAAYRTPKMKKQAFNPYDEAAKFIEQVEDQIVTRGASLHDQRVSISSFDRQGRRCLRVVRNGETVYSLDMWTGAFSNDEGLSFHGGRGKFTGGTGAINAWGQMTWERESEDVVLDLHDMNLFGPASGDRIYSKQEFIDALWNQICDLLEEN